MLKPTSPIPANKRKFVDVTLAGARFHNVDLTGAKLRGVLMSGVEIDGDIDGLTVNGVEVAPLIRAEIDRRHPEHKWLRSSNPTWLRRAAQTIYANWESTLSEARSLPEAAWRTQVDDEWSLLETLRHLIFAHDAWFRRAVLRQDDPFWSGGLVTSDMPPWVPQSCGINTRARPSIDAVLAERALRRAEVIDFLDGVTADALSGSCRRPKSKGYPATPQRYTVGRCIRIVLYEEWAHHQFAVRDLARLREGA